MTLPYAAYPLERALTGIQQAGYRFIASRRNTRDVLVPKE
jgi:hypothetical protein